MDWEGSEGGVGCVGGKVAREAKLRRTCGLGRVSRLGLDRGHVWRGRTANTPVRKCAGEGAHYTEGRGGEGRGALYRGEGWGGARYTEGRRFSRLLNAE